MSATGRPDASAPSASDVAARLRDAGLVRLCATPDGDALAATGVLARALSDADIAFQASVTRRLDAGTEADATVTVGQPGGDLALVDEPVSVTAHDAAAALSSADPTLALAGVAAAGDAPGEHADLLEAAGLERRPGVAVPVADLADGLAHSTLVHAPFSGDREAAIDALSGLDGEEDGRTVASMVALAAVRDAPGRAAEAVERALHPYACDRFETLGGYADVLDAVAREAPGTGVALALGHDATDAALSAWRDHAARAHEALDGADPLRYDGLTVVRAGGDAPLGTVARLLRDFRAEEPVALALGDGAAAVAATAAVQDPWREAAATCGVEAHGRGTTGRIENIDGEQFVSALREVL